MPPETVRAALAAAARRLEPVSATPRLDAELLMAHVLGRSRDAMLLAALDDPAPPAFADLVARRKAGEPVAYITGTRAFWTIDLGVTPAVLIPRPDSETLIEAAVDHFARAGRAPASVIDLGTGSGALLLAALAEWPEALGLGIDRSPAALAVAAANAGRLGMGARARFAEGDWTRAGWADALGRFDLLLCNPPYVESDAALARDVMEHEPHGALFAGADGLDDYRRLAPAIPRLIAPGGMAAIEIGHRQAAAVSALLAAEGAVPTVRRDLGGRDRCIIVAAEAS
ncbi:N5-glutamine S-adenosyl-L-methionine-dependent methyltransferase [Sphingomonas sp. MM-1]|uniref:peptide chain release factor N(5)-glutamine methyltransferase n=1 Tax=Sphingomonas sp. MM-1 TaxID=745310 RepID=UPI0002C073B5|nr:peptide chain release factor N(5)-glutamine methyltransferase [Sphingomonas sp. MM-1]AGH49851.1 N5-glutamine S-adenosyl-L-methionine-dependent methyltransferase [Sphingomonas sp. MM-1]